MTAPVPVVTDLEVLGNFVLRLAFQDGTVGDVDLQPRMRGPVFESLRNNLALFAQARVDPELGTVVWPNGADIAPETLYREAPAQAV